MYEKFGFQYNQMYLEEDNTINKVMLIRMFLNNDDNFICTHSKLSKINSYFRSVSKCETQKTI